jgi:predicted nucleic acid-binding protein
MSRIVLDASVLIKLYINEEGSRRAVAAVKKAEALVAPDLLWLEAGNILWKYVRRGDLDLDAGQSMLRDMLQMPIAITASSGLVEQAFEIATQTDRTIYDSVYLALAVQAKAVILTADQRMVHALADQPLGKFILGL